MQLQCMCGCIVFIASSSPNSPKNSGRVLDEQWLTKQFMDLMEALLSQEYCMVLVAPKLHILQWINLTIKTLI